MRKKVFSITKYFNWNRGKNENDLCVKQEVEAITEYGGNRIFQAGKMDIYLIY